MEAQSKVNEAKGFYLYCLFSGDAPSLSGLKGVDSKERLFVISHRDLSALVSQVSLAQYNEERLSQRFKELDWVASRVQRHEAVIRYLTSFQPAVPLKFCTIFKSKEKVLELLRSHYQRLCSFLELIRGKEEWNVKVYAQEGPFREAAERSCPGLNELDEKLFRVLPGEAYLLKKVREGLVNGQISELKDKLSDEIYQQLLSWCEDGRRNRLLSREASGREEEMFLNMALLLKKEEVESFKAKLDGLADNYEGYRLLFEISGPWPPYNFCPELEPNPG